MNKLHKIAIIVGVSSLLVSWLMAEQWSFRYQLKGDGYLKSDQVSVPSACEVDAYVEAIAGTGEWIQNAAADWVYVPGYAYAEVAVMGPNNYLYNQVINTPVGDSYVIQNGQSTAGTYTVYAMGAASTDGQAFVRVDISW